MARSSTAGVGVEWALTMLGGGGNPAAWWDVGGERTGHDTSGHRRRPVDDRPGQRLHRGIA